MKDFIFHVGQIPSGYSFSFTESLFNQEEHRQLQSKSNWHSFYILNQGNRTIDGSIHFHLQDEIAKSPFKATHGGFDSYSELRQEVLSAFVLFVEEQLRKSGAIKILIKLPLRISDNIEYNPVEETLLNNGFQIALKESGCMLVVSQAFDKKIHRSEKTPLKKSMDGRFEFKNVLSNELEAVYYFLHQRHKEKNYELSMSFQEVQDLALQFPENILLFVVRDKNNLVAASICIRVNDKVLYDFYHDHESTYNSFSPIVFLIKGINDYAIANQIPLIDLGTAMIGDKVNTSLLEFKLKLGGKHGVKYSFEKKCV